MGDNAPSGVFVDNAEGLITRAEPSASREQRTKQILAAIAETNRWGLIGIHDAGEPRSTIDIFESLAKAGNYNLRNYVLISDDSADILHYASVGPRSDLYNGRLWVRAIKLYADGALGSRGAALLAPYSDDPGNTGLLVSAPAHLERVDQGVRRGHPPEDADALHIGLSREDPQVADEDARYADPGQPLPPQPDFGLETIGPAGPQPVDAGFPDSVVG
jgi:predicted amidohydrolase YtcJ